MKGIDLVAAVEVSASITSPEVGGGIGRLVKPRHLSWVSSITKIASLQTMQAAVSSVNCGLLLKPSAA